MEMPYIYGKPINCPKVIGIFNRYKPVYPQNVLLSIYHSLFASHLNYGLLFMGYTCKIKFQDYIKKTVRIMQFYTAH